MNGCVSKTIKGSVKVYHESSKMISFGNSISIIEGYLFNLNTQENRVVSALKELLSNGLFQMILQVHFQQYVVSDNLVRFCNDCIGIYPLYYFINNDILYYFICIYWMSYLVLQFDVLDYSKTWT